MVPIVIHPRSGRFGLAGNGARTLRRLQALKAAGAVDVRVYADAPEAALAAAWPGLLPRLPEEADLRELHALWVVDLPEMQTAGLVQSARAVSLLVNVEDCPESCDFHSLAEIRRKNLLLTVSTGGTVPGAAATLRRHLERVFGPEWEDRLDELAELREAWRAEGVAMSETARRIDALMAERGWLPFPQIP